MPVDLPNVNVYMCGVVSLLICVALPWPDESAFVIMDCCCCFAKIIDAHHDAHHGYVELESPSGWGSIAFSFRRCI
eukprot:scaffold8374_cov29-Prasinocladus_malaysianus.AAC.3